MIAASDYIYMHMKILVCSNMIAMTRLKHFQKSE